MSKISSNTLKTFFRQIISLLIQLSTITIIARVLGVEGNGQYAIIILLPKFLSMVLSLGLNSSNIYFIGKKQYSIGTVYSTTLLLSFFIIIVGGIIGYITIKFYSNTLFPHINKDILFLSLLIFPSSFLLLLHLSFIRAKENFNDYNIISLSNPIIFLIFILFLLFFQKISILNIIYISIISPLISLFISIFYINRNGYIFKLKYFSKKYLKDSLLYGLKSHASNLVAFITYRTDLFLLNLLLSPVFVGLYFIAVQIVERLWIISGVMSTVLFPRFVSIKDKKERLLLISKSFKIAIIVTTLISIGIVLFGHFLIGVLFGKEYFDSYFAILYLLPGIIFGAGSSILANAISAKGRPELNMYTSLIEMILNIFLNFTLIPIYGFLGAAIATSFSYIVNTILKIFLFKKIEPLFAIRTLVITIEDIKFLINKIYKLKKGKS